jgi:predicted ATPase/DNA-binding winged helix-turn-helix (wHTH) protein
MSSPQWHFADFRLDPANACLWRGTQSLALTPKAFEVLHYLVSHPDRLVSKDELLDAVWPETAISDAVVRIAIGEVRRVLGDTAQAPRFIATVYRRGYRFLAPVTHADPPDAASAPSPAVAPEPTLPYRLSEVARPLVGREAVLARLHAVWAQARQGQRQVLFLTGEPGIGKTAVVEAFVAHVRQDPAVWVAAGQCIEHYGPGEPYLPILEALGQLCRGPAGAHLGPGLRQQAPTWLVQMPWLLTQADREHLHQELQGSTRERMLREFAELIETLTAVIPLLLVLEDLHWSDHATLDLLALLARRRAPARFLLLGTFRPVETIVHSHPLRPVVQALQREGQVATLPLAPLQAEAVTAYLTVRFPAHRLPASLVPWLLTHTDGNPLFLVTMVAALVERGVLAEHAGHWRLQRPLDAAELGVPEGIRSLLEQQIERLPADLQQVLEVASVVGVTFAVAGVAAGLEAPTAQIETQCETLARYHLVQQIGLAHWPDETVTTHYAFTHALYQQVAYERIGVGRRLQLHHRLGDRLEAAYGTRVREVAAELAAHFGRGQDAWRAVHYLHQAAENAAQRYAPHEVTTLLTRSLALLRELPESPERAQQELDIHVLLGPALMATRGYAAPEVEQTYARARALCQQVGETPQLFPVLRGLCQFYRNNGAFLTARELGEQLVHLAQREALPTLCLEAHEELGATLYHLGEFAAAWIYLEQGIALIDPMVQRAQVLRDDVVPGVRCLVYASLTLWCLGYPIQAMQRGQEALTLTRDLAHLPSLALVQHFVAFLHYYRRDVPALQAQAETLLTLATAHDFPLWAGFSTLWEGWAMAVQGQSEAGLARMHQGVGATLALRQTGSSPARLLLLAEAGAHAGQVDEGLRFLAEALTAFEAVGRGNLLAETYRLQGELLLCQSVSNVVQAEACFQQALSIARRQQARSWELRVATSLARLWQQQGKRTEAYDLLAPVYDWFTEGFDTVDLLDAHALLSTLATEP